MVFIDYEDMPRRCEFVDPRDAGRVICRLPDKSDAPAPSSVVEEERAEEVLEEVGGTVAAEPSTLSGGVRLKLPDRGVIVPEAWAEDKERVWIDRGEGGE